MKSLSTLLLTLAAFSLVACNSTPTKVDTGAVRARTFNFVNRDSKPVPGFVNNLEPVHNMIQKSITQNLAARGVSKVGGGGDLTVRYLLIKGNNVSTLMINDYFGYGGNVADLHDKAQDAYTGTKNPNSFEAGTLLIDLVDGKTFKLLKRGYATRPILQNVTSSARAARIQEVVNEILRDVKIAP